MFSRSMESDKGCPRILADDTAIIHLAELASSTEHRLPWNRQLIPTTQREENKEVSLIR
jgi:hypothetical protein